MKKNNISIFRWGTPGPWSKIWVFASILLLARVAGHAQGGQAPFQLFGRVEVREAVVDPGRRALPVGQFKLDRAAYARLMLEQPPSLQVPLPTDSSPVELLLERVELLTPDFKLTNERGEPFQVPAGVFYQGNIKGDSTSFVLLSCFEDQVSGYIGLEGRSYALDKRPGAAATLYDLITAESPAGEGDRPPLCGETTEVGGPRAAQQLAQQLQQLNPTTREFPVLVMDKMVTVHFECDNALYVSLGADPAAVQRFITQMFNSVHGIYRLEGIVVRIKSIRLWSVTDPYADQTTLSVGGEGQGVLRDFANEIGGTLPNGANLAHLLTTRTFGDAGGLAWRTAGVFCSTSWNGQHWVGPFAVSAALEGNLPFPFYSWNAYVVAHEMGHNLGLPHTHNCAWVGGALDNCASPESGLCPPGPSPQNGGTIMSYCHQYQFINFRNAFGVQPGNLMRYNIAAAPCLDLTVEPRLLVSSTQLNLGPTAGTGNIGVTTLPSGTDWQVSADATWVTLPQSEGKGNGSIAFSYIANPGPSARSATIEIMTETNTVSVRLLQSAPSLSTSLSPPVVLGMLPESGPVGTVLTLSGTDFNPVAAKNIVYFGPVVAQVLSATATSLSVRVPEGATHAPVTVLNKDNGLMGSSSKPFMLGFDLTDLESYSFYRADVAPNKNKVSVADIDGDGKTDFASAYVGYNFTNNSWVNYLKIYLNNLVDTSDRNISENSFSAPIVMELEKTNPRELRHVKFAELDGDGKVDMAYLDEGLGILYVFINKSSQGNVQFQDRKALAVPDRTSAFTIADIDGDGRQDIVGVSLTTQSFSILRNLSGPGFLAFEKAELSYLPGLRIRPDDIHANDYDLDGKIDLCVSGSRSRVDSLRVIFIFPNSSFPGTISFKDPIVLRPLTDGYWFSKISSSDLDGDGKMDILTLQPPWVPQGRDNYEKNSFVAFRNLSVPGNISFAASQKVIENESVWAYDFFTGDLDGDKRPELVTFDACTDSNNPDPVIAVYKNQSAAGSFTFANKLEFQLCTPITHPPYGCALADFNGDGYSDLMVPKESTSFFFLFLKKQNNFALSCGSIGNTGTLYENSPAFGVKTQVPYTNGNRVVHRGAVAYSTGVEGLRATLVAGALASGSGYLEFEITGTPSDTGQARFSFSFLGQHCAFSHLVNPPLPFNPVSCGAYTAPGEWKEFMCFNLGSTYTGTDSVKLFTPSWEVNGGYWQWGKKEVAALGPVGPATSQANHGTVPGWSSVEAPNGAWSDDTKTANDPCPKGFRIPSIEQWRGVIANNEQSRVGTWTSSSPTNYSTGRLLGPKLFLPAAGERTSYNTLENRGLFGFYWSSSEESDTYGGYGKYIFFQSTQTYSDARVSRTAGRSVRCISDGTPTAGAIGTLDCGDARNLGTLTSGVKARKVFSKIPYTDGDGGTYGGFSVQSSGVTGLTAVLLPGRFSEGSDSLLIEVTGIPSGAGMASFSLNIGGRVCILERNVKPVGSVASLDCSNASWSGPLVLGSPADGVVFDVPYTGGNGGTYPRQVIASTGITGLTATLVGGVLANGTGTLQYQVQGVPASLGTVNFILAIGSSTCTLARSVTLRLGRVNQLGCSGSLHNGTLVAGIPAANVSSQIPYPGGNGGTHNGQTVASAGVTGLTATLLPGVFAVGTGSLTYSITGTPSGVGTATFAINIGGLSCTLTRTVGNALSTLNCFSAAHSGTLSVGVPAAAVSSSIGYSGGNGGSHGGQVVASTGVTGLTATLAPGTFANGQGTLVYTITGTPSRTGTASFALSIGGAKCTLTRNVSAAIASLNCSGVTHNGTLTTGVVASGVSSQISYSGGNGAAYAGYKVLSTGVTGLTATLAPGTFANGAGTLTLSITGTPVGSGSANFALSIGGRGCTLRRSVGSALTSLDCAAAVHSGALAAGIAAAGASSQLSYTGGNGSAYAGQSVASTGVGGLTATLAPGTFANGAGTLTYMIAGTADRAGTAVFALNIGGRACTLQRTVVQAGTIASLGCSSAVHSGTLSAGVAASSVSSSIPYTGGDGGAYPGLSIASTGVTGLTATLAPGTFANGAGTLTFALSGTPSENGVARFALSLGGRSCVLERVIGTLPTGSVAFLDCIGATRIGALTAGSPASGVSSSIAYIGGVAGTHAGQVVASTGVTGLTATLPAGTIASGEGELTYTISGTPSAAGLASFAIDIGGQSCTLTRVVASVPGTISSLLCASASHTGALTVGAAASGVTSSVPYTGGNSGSHGGQSVASSGVLGLTATLLAGSFADGAGTLTYVLSGTPSRTGTASFVLNIGGVSCILKRSVGAAISGLNCSGATHSGTLEAGTAANSVSSILPYTGGNGSAYPGQGIPSTGVTGLTATLLPGTLATGTGSLTLSITGTPLSAGTARFAVTIGGRGCTLLRTVSAPSSLLGVVSSMSTKPDAQGQYSSLPNQQDQELAAPRLLVFPNPTDGRVNLQVAFPGKEETGWLRVLDALGRQVGPLEKLQAGEYTFNLSGRPAGMYYFILLDKEVQPVADRKVVLY